jgi:hypothetical protein
MLRHCLATAPHAAKILGFSIPVAAQLLKEYAGDGVTGVERRREIRGVP